MNMNPVQNYNSPVINGSEVIFTYKGKADKVWLAGDYNRWELKDRMKKSPDRDEWHITKHFPENARFDYKYIVDDNWIADPRNPNIRIREGGDNSILVMPEYKSRYEDIISQKVPHGKVISNQRYQSEFMRDEMNFHVYVPAGYEKEKTNHILYAFDGSDYLNYSKINLILDYMIDKEEIPRLVAVLADPYERNRDYTIYKPYYNFIVNELMSFVEDAYLRNQEQSAHAADRSVIGASWGGLTALYLAINTPGKFCRILSQSGSFWPKDWLIYDMVDKAETSNLQLVLQTGTIEDTEEMNDEMYKLLISKGYKTEYLKYAETHHWDNWKGHLDEGLRRLYNV